VNAPWSRHVALIATIAALIGAGCTAGAPTGSLIGSAAPNAAGAAQPSPSVVPAASEEASQRVESPSADPSAVTVSDPPDPPDTIDGTAGPGCGTGRAGLIAHNDEVPAVLHFGGATIEFTTAFLALRNGTYGADDSIPAGVGLTASEIAVKVAPGTHILLRGDGLVLTKSVVRVVPWSTVSFDGGLGASPATPVDLPARLRTDGSISVSAPLEVGDYMVEFFPRFHSECLEGDGSAYSRIKIVAP
jgi:hypothetical protein